MEISQHINLLANLAVGTTFLFSGIVKLNDPLGFSYKIEEYLHILVNQFTGYLRLLLPYTQVLAVCIATLEVVLGTALLVYWQYLGVLMALLSLTLFFTLLTLYTAISKRLTSCGCLGDILILTPWQSFTKNIILLFFNSGLYWQGKSDSTKLTSDYWVAASLLFSLGLSGYTLRHLPILDFLPYKVGNSLAKHLSRATPRGTHLFIWQGNQEVTQALFLGNKLLIVTQDPVFMTTRKLHKLNTFIQQLRSTLQPMLLTPSGRGKEAAAALRIEYYTANPLLLRTMLRAPVGLLLLKDGIVAHKWHYYDLDIAQKTLKQLGWMS